jgi:hypothetical protein
LSLHRDNLFLERGAGLGFLTLTACPDSCAEERHRYQKKKRLMFATGRCHDRIVQRDGVRSVTERFRHVPFYSTSGVYPVISFIATSPTIWRLFAEILSIVSMVVW